ncbi:MAG: Type 1 glutamine amidotransferase-like domain-containing protein [Nanoarchaeota archaeon]
MKKLLLTSTGFDNEKVRDKFFEIIDKPKEEIKILYIPTASNVEKDKFYVEENKIEIFNSGISKKNLFEFDLDRNPDYKVLDNIDSIYIEGGNTFYLMKRLNETKFSDKICELVNKGVAYVGVSAGTIIAGPDIRIAFDNNNIKLKNYAGINLTGMIIAPHYAKDREKRISKIEKEISQSIYRLKDGEALLILNEKVRLIR